MRSYTFAKVGVVGIALLAVAGAASPAVATTNSLPSIRNLAVSPSTITTAGSSATVSATVAHASSCTLSSKPKIAGLPVTFPCKSGAVSKVVTPYANYVTTRVKYALTLKAKGSGGSTSAKVTLSVAQETGTLTGVVSVASGTASSTGGSTNGPSRRLHPDVSGAKYGAFCAVMNDGTVQCWGDGETGALGDGTYGYSDSAVQVVGVDGTGLLSDVVSVAGNDLSFCALLDSGNVDCWGSGYWGDLGNGVFYPNNPGGSDVPVQVSGVGGSGLLSGVSSIDSDGNDTYCAILDTGQVDCWGSGAALGNGVVYLQSCSAPCDMSQLASATPVQVLDPDAVDLMSGVQSMTAGSDSFCAVLTSGGVDCWGYDKDGQNGDGTFVTSGDPVTFTPTAVLGVGGSGLLSGVTNLASDGWYGFCATVSGAGADCWGWGSEGELGNGASYPDSGSGSPVQVASEDGTTTLSSLASITGSLQNFCALLTSGDVDCWGQDEYGALGDGVYSNNGYLTSDLPVSVVDTTGAGQLSGVTAVTGGEMNYCATLSSGGLDCWGQGNDGQLGNGILYNQGPAGDGTPSQVLGGVNGPYLTAVQQVSTAIESGNSTFCALFGSADQVACWGFGNDGELGDGNVYPQGNATPVDVVPS